jgi:hypothetical protein
VDEPREAWLRAWAAVLGGLAAVFLLATIPLSLLSRQIGDGIVAVVIGIPCAAVGAVVARRQPRNPLGWLFLMTAVFLLAANDGGDYSYFVYRLGHHIPLGPAALALETGLLVGAYAGLVLLSTDVLGLSSSVAVAASTLAAAAAFSPLRRRVQRIVDRRFNRARYDADVTVAAFAARLKDQMDLDSVRADLVSVVNQTLEPAHCMVRLRDRG